MKKVKRWVDYVLFVSRFKFGYMLELPLGCFTKIKKILKKTCFFVYKRRI